MLNLKQPPYIQSLQRERAWIEIDLAALAYNVKQLKSLLSPSTQLMAVVKADAYGHGAINIARTALDNGAEWLGVATVPEGIELRENGLDAPILVLGAVNTQQQINAVVQWKLEPTLCTLKQAMIFSQTLENTKGNFTLPVHLKIDTGMSRLGIPWQEAAQFGQLVKSLPHLKIASIYSHLANADNFDDTYTEIQNFRYQEALAHLESVGIVAPKLHLANSAATLVNSELHYDLVRVGLAIYGLYPASHLENIINLKPVLQVKAKITQIKNIKKGTGVSYGHQYIAQKNTIIAVVGIGYADGIPRNLSNYMSVLVRGQRVPQIGNITMDQLIIDVSKIHNLQEGETVTIIGQDNQETISVDDWANFLKTISWEIICGFKNRLPRINIYSKVT
jgi:alanine racemase